jgi:16S rRNA (cytosine1402-N4)-methyltransferase
LIRISASEFIRVASEEDIARIMRDFGELYQQSRRIGKELAGNTFKTTVELREVIERVFTFKAKSILPQVFQALRMAVNDELGVLQTLLEAGPLLLARGGRMGVISFHSLEDRMVKHAFRALTTPVKDDITGKISVEAAFELVHTKAIVPTPEEIALNPRARSVKFRILKRRE